MRTISIALLAAALSACSHQQAAQRGGDPGDGHPHGRHDRADHRFRDAAAWARRFEGPKRDSWQRPEQVLALLDLRPDMKVADIGAGTGYFAVRLARAVPRGQVFAVDVERSMVDYLDRRAAQEGLSNLRGVLAASTDPRLPAAVDLVFLCNTYHHLADRTAYFRRLAGRLAPGGRVAVVDFKQGPLPVGPPEGHRVSPGQLERELTAAGYRRLLLDSTTLPHQYVALFGRGESEPGARAP